MFLDVRYLTFSFRGSHTVVVVFMNILGTCHTKLTPRARTQKRPGLVSAGELGAQMHLHLSDTIDKR